MTSDRASSSQDGYPCVPWIIIQNKFEYYSFFCLTLLIRKTINAVTVMSAVMEIIQKLINAVTVMPVKMCQTISKHIMFGYHYRFCYRFDFFNVFLADVGIAYKYARESF